MADRITAALCGKYLGDNDATCPQLTCIRRRGHDGRCDNVRGDDDRITTAEALRLAREALEDDKRATPADKWIGGVSVYEDPDGDEDMACGRCPMLTRKKGESYTSLKVRASVDANVAANSRTREPALARAVVAMLTATDSSGIAEENARRIAATYMTMVGGATSQGCANHCSALAAALWRAADEADGGGR